MQFALDETRDCAPYEASTSQSPSVISIICNELLKEVDDNESKAHMTNARSQDESFSAKIVPVVKAVETRLLSESESKEEYMDFSSLPSRIQSLFHKLINQAKARVDQIQEPDQPVTSDAGNASPSQSVGSTLASYHMNTGNICSRVFILQVLTSMRDFLLDGPPPSSHISAIVKDKIDTWFAEAKSYCLDPMREEADRSIYGGTIFNMNNPRTYWTESTQFLGWWKNNIERKLRFREIEQEAANLSNMSLTQRKPEDCKTQRIRWCQRLVAIVREIKAYVGGHNNVPSAKPLTQHQRSLLQQQSQIESTGVMTNDSLTSVNLEISESHGDNILSGFATKPFVITLYDLVSDASEPSIQWYRDGVSFIIINPVVFVHTVLPKYFKLVHVADFLHLLSIHGFTARTLEIPRIQTFQHPLFVHGRREFAQIMSVGPTNIQVTQQVLKHLSSLRKSHMTTTATLFGSSSTSSDSHVEDVAAIVEAEQENPVVVKATTDETTPSVPMNVDENDEVAVQASSDNLTHSTNASKTTAEKKAEPQVALELENYSASQIEIYLSMYRHLLTQGILPLSAISLIQQLIQTPHSQRSMDLLHIDAATSKKNNNSGAVDATSKATDNAKTNNDGTNIDNASENKAVYNGEGDHSNDMNQNLDTVTTEGNNVSEPVGSKRSLSYQEALHRHQHKRQYDVQTTVPLAVAWAAYYAAQQQQQLEQQQQQQQSQLQLQQQFLRGGNHHNSNNNNTNSSKQRRRVSGTGTRKAEDPDNGEESGFTSSSTGKKRTSAYFTANATTAKATVAARATTTTTLSVGAPADDTPIIDLRHPRQRRIFLDFTVLSPKNTDAVADIVPENSDLAPGTRAEVVPATTKKQYQPIYGVLHGKIVQKGNVKHIYSEFVDEHQDYEEDDDQDDDVDDNLAISQTEDENNQIKRRRSTKTTSNARRNASSNTSSSNGNGTSNNSREEWSYPKRTSRVGANYQADIPEFVLPSSTGLPQESRSRSAVAVMEETQQEMCTQLSSLPSHSTSPVYGLIWSPVYDTAEKESADTNRNGDNNSASAATSTVEKKDNSISQLNIDASVGEIVKRHLWSGSLPYNRQIVGNSNSNSSTIVLLAAKGDIIIAHIQLKSTVIRLVTRQSRSNQRKKQRKQKRKNRRRKHQNGGGDEEDNGDNEEEDAAEEDSSAASSSSSIMSIDDDDDNTRETNSEDEENSDDSSNDEEEEEEVEEIEDVVSLCTVTNITSSGSGSESIMYEVFDGERTHSVPANQVVTVLHRTSYSTQYNSTHHNNTNHNPHHSRSSSSNSSNNNSNVTNKNSAHSWISEEDVLFVLLQVRGDTRALLRHIISLCDTSAASVTTTSNAVSSSPAAVPKHALLLSATAHHHQQQQQQQTLLLPWSAEEVKQFCSAQRRFGDHVYRICRQYFCASNTSSSVLDDSTNHAHQKTFREVLQFFHLCHPSLQRGKSRQLCAIYRRAEEVLHFLQSSSPSGATSSAIPSPSKHHVPTIIKTETTAASAAPLVLKIKSAGSSRASSQRTEEATEEPNDGAEEAEDEQTEVDAANTSNSNSAHHNTRRKSVTRGVTTAKTTTNTNNKHKGNSQPASATTTETAAVTTSERSFSLRKRSGASTWAGAAELLANKRQRTTTAAASTAATTTTTTTHHSGYNTRRS